MKKNTCCEDGGAFYSVESIVGVDDRGQMVLPKEVREKLGIRAGDKLAVVMMERRGKPCCVTLIRADALADTVKEMIGPFSEQVKVK